MRQVDLDYHVATAGYSADSDCTRVSRGCCTMQAVDPLATIVHREAAYKVGKALAARLKELIPRQQFKVPIQAAIGARIVASEAIPGIACTPPHPNIATVCTEDAHVALPC